MPRSVTGLSATGPNLYPSCRHDIESQIVYRTVDRVKRHFEVIRKSDGVCIGRVERRHFTPNVNYTGSRIRRAFRGSHKWFAVGLDHCLTSQMDWPTKWRAAASVWTTFHEKEIAAEVEAFNAMVPVGTPVRFWPGVRNAEPKLGNVRSKAWVLGGHTAVVKVTGYAGGIALSHVESDWADR